MSSDPVRLLMIAPHLSPRVQSAVEDVRAFLESRNGVTLAGVLTGDHDDATDIPEADVAVVLGGDGAIFCACRSFGERQIPILGVNLGRLGFLADVSPDDFRQRIDAIEQRQFSVVHHVMFQCVHESSAADRETFLGLNEVAVHAAGSLSMIEVHVCIDNHHVTVFSGDGLIISTPVGSTAHNLSAGGPILRQDLPAFVMTPICPHTLTVRPVVDRADCIYTLRVPAAPEGVMLVVDGQISRPFRPDDTLTVRQARVTFQLVRFPEHSYYATLQRKLGWGGNLRNGDL